MGKAVIMIPARTVVFSRLKRNFYVLFFSGYLSMSSANSNDERKFAVLSKASVKVYAESIGITELPDDVSQRLAEDVSYRVREIVSKSCEFMRHCRRKNLKSTDIERAFQWTNIQPICGVNPSTDYNSSNEVYFLDDPVVNLKEIALQEPAEVERSNLSLQTEWLTKYDIQRAPGTEKSENAEQESLSAKRKVFTDYYTSLVECIFSDNQVLFDEMLVDIRRNSKIGPLVTYLVNFVAGANLVSHDLTKLSRILFVIRALFCNHHISLQLFLKPLLDAVVYCVMEPLAASINPLNDHWLLRDYGALLISQISYSYPSETDYLLSHLNKTIIEILSDFTRPLCSHYGAMMTLSKLSVDVIKKILLALMENYTNKFLLPVIEDPSPNSANLKEDAQKVLGAVVLCVEKLHFQYDFNGRNRAFVLPNVIINSSFNDLFGESLVSRLPLHNFRLKNEISTTSENLKSDPFVPIAHHCVAFGYSASRNVNQSQHRRRWKVSEVFTLPPRQNFLHFIKMNTGVKLPARSRWNRLQLNQAESVTFARNPSMHLMRRKNPKPKQLHFNTSLWSWI